MTKVHSTSPSKSFTAVLEKSDNKLWGCHVPVPNSIAGLFMKGKSKRIICTLNKKERYQCSLLHFKKGKVVISVNKTIRDALGVTFGDTVHVTVQSDTSEYGLPLPEELKECFRQDSEGKKLFHLLTPGKQRTMLYIINNIKDSEKRIFRSLTIIRHLKEQQGKIDYKKLNIQLRNSSTVLIH